MIDASAPVRAVTPQRAVDVLNTALTLEPQAISDLFRHRVGFQSDELAHHDTIQVGYLDEQDPHKAYDLGMLGLLNGIFGDTNRRGFIVIHVDDDFYENPDSLIEKFEVEK